MPATSAKKSAAKKSTVKKSMAKALPQKELAVAQALSSAPTLARRTCTGAQPVVPAPDKGTVAPTATAAEVPALTLVRRMHTGAWPVVPALDEGNAAEVPQDLSPVVIETAREMELSAELAIACARLAMTDQELRVARNVAAGHACMVIPWVNHPAKIGNLQVAMRLENDYFKFHKFQVNVGKYAMAVGLEYNTHWSDQDLNKLALVASMLKENDSYFEHYMGDWPLKVHLQKHFNNQRYYACTKARKAAASGSSCICNMGDMGNAGDVGDAGNGGDAGDAGDVDNAE